MQSFVAILMVVSAFDFGDAGKTMEQELMEVGRTLAKLESYARDQDNDCGFLHPHVDVYSASMKAYGRCLLKHELGTDCDEAAVSGWEEAAKDAGFAQDDDKEWPGVAVGVWGMAALFGALSFVASFALARVFLGAKNESASQLLLGRLALSETVMGAGTVLAGVYGVVTALGLADAVHSPAACLLFRTALMDLSFYARLLLMLAVSIDRVMVLRGNGLKYATMDKRNYVKRWDRERFVPLETLYVSGMQAFFHSANLVLNFAIIYARSPDRRLELRRAIRWANNDAVYPAS